MAKTIPSLVHHKQSFREALSWKLVNTLKPFYFFLRRRRKPWDITLASLQEMPSKTLGHDLFLFLKEHELAIMPRAEFHDVYHVLFGYGTDIRGEALVQFVPLGNGKLSLPYVASTLMSALFYPEYWNDFRLAFRRGRQAKRFYDWDFEVLLGEETSELRRQIFGKEWEEELTRKNGE